MSSCIQCSAQQYFNNRLKYVDGLKSSGGTPYPHKFPVSTTLTEYVEAYKDLEGGQQLQDTTVTVAGRLRAGTISQAGTQCRDELSALGFGDRTSVSACRRTWRADNGCRTQP